MNGMTLSVMSIAGTLGTRLPREIAPWSGLVRPTPRPRTRGRGGRALWTLRSPSAFGIRDDEPFARPASEHVEMVRIHFGNDERDVGVHPVHRRVAEDRATGGRETLSRSRAPSPSAGSRTPGRGSGGFSLPHDQTPAHSGMSPEAPTGTPPRTTCRPTGPRRNGGDRKLRVAVEEPAEARAGPCL